jgi:hypothetical protein
MGVIAAVGQARPTAGRSADVAADEEERQNVLTIQRARAAAARAAGDTLRKDFAKHQRSAGRPVRTGAWRLTGSGMTHHVPGGCWGQIVFREPYMSGEALILRLFAGSLHPHLMRWVNDIAPDKSPPNQFVVAHAHILWSFEIEYVADSQGTPEPLALPQPSHHPTRPRLGAATVEGWITDAYRLLMPEVERLCTDEGLLAHLMRVDPQREVENYFILRYAALLARHMGRTDVLPAVLERAERAAEAAHERMFLKYRDRSTRYPQDWSHKRFLRFLAETPV